MVISLIGYRGTGKSAVAQPLAEKLGWDWIDADTETERRAGCSIAEIFAAEGEAGFRQRERSVLQDLLAQDRLVLAAGGGAVLNEQTRQQMRQAGPVIWLQASPETILQRMQNDATTAHRRPALTGDEPRREVEELLSARTPLYEECADIVVTTDDRAVNDIVAEILQRLPADITGEGDRL